MEEQKRFMTSLEAGIILGGETQPFSNTTIDKLIRRGRLRATTVKNRGRRIIGSSAYALADHLENGGDLWEGEIGSAETDRSTSIQKEVGDGTRKFQLGAAKRSSLPSAKAKKKQSQRVLV